MHVKFQYKTRYFGHNIIEEVPVMCSIWNVGNLIRYRASDGKWGPVQFHIDRYANSSAKAVTPDWLKAMDGRVWASFGMARHSIRLAECDRYML